MTTLSAIISILIAEGAGIIGSVFTASSVKGWYTTITKPSWNPPSWVFGPVWTTLYLLMGLAAAMVWERKDMPGAHAALWAYGIQLVLNALWTIIFFGLKKPGFAFAEIVVLLAAIIVTTILFWKVSPVSGALMLPYLAWTCFASFLNFSLWRLN